MDCLKDRDGICPPIPVPKNHVACQAADLYAYSIYQTAMQGGKPFLAYQYFMEKLRFPRERRDGRIFREELEEYLRRPAMIMDGMHAKIPIPTRAETEGYDFTFKGNTKKKRRQIPKL
jgi:hypothetical protein